MWASLQSESQESLTKPSHSLLPRPTFLFTLPRLSFTLVHNPSSIVRSTLEIRPRHELAHFPTQIFRTCKKNPSSSTPLTN